MSSDRDLKAFIATGSCVVGFTASWAVASRNVPEWLKALDGIRTMQADIDDYQDECRELGITVAPTLAVFKDGKLLDARQGLMTLETAQRFVREALR